MIRVFIPTLALGTLVGCPALAELTAKDVWDQWQTTAAHNGITLSAAQVDTRADGLALVGLDLTWASPINGLELDVPTVVLTEQNGTVVIGIDDPVSAQPTARAM